MRMRTVCAATLVILLAGCATSSNPAQEAAVAAAVKTYDQRVAAMDSLAIASMYTDDGELRHDGEVLARGHDQIYKFLQQFDGKYKVLENTTTIDAIDMLRGGIASVQAHFAQKTRDLKTGKVEQPMGHVDFEWVQVNGNWYIRSTDAIPQ
jgi:ketosteroid isomerase-like protein